MTTNLDFSEAFPSSLGNYPSSNGAIWLGTDGNTAVGCASVQTGEDILAEPTTPYVVFASDQPTLTFWARIFDADIVTSEVLSVTIGLALPSNDINFLVLGSGIVVPDTGWLEYTWPFYNEINPTATIDFIRFNTQAGATSRIDDIFLSAPAASEFKVSAGGIPGSILVI